MSPMPVFNPVGEKLYEQCAPWATDDAKYDYPLAHYCHALSLTLWKAYRLVMDDAIREGVPGWAAIFDADLVPIEYLPWTAQLVGVRIPPGLTEADQRAFVKRADGFRRGTPDALKAAVLGTLTGTKTLIVRERYGGAYKLHVITYADETPDQTAALAAIKTQKPGGITLTYQVNTGQDLQSVSNMDATLQGVSDRYATLQAIADAKPAI